MVRAWRHAIALAVIGAGVSAGASPGVAEAHGPVAPIATSYLAKVSRAPAGLEAKVVDGDQRMWLRVPVRATVVVLDYRGAPYLRFARSGVDVNESSAMFYLNQNPAETPPSGLSPSARPRWHPVSGGHDYGWHDGRLHALATVALSPGATYVGTWSVPVLIDGRRSSISGGLWHADDPSLVWFWPIVVLLGCVLAARRLRRPELDLNVARVLAIAALIAIAAGGAGRELHGRPAVSIFQAITLAVILAFVAYGLGRIALRRHGYFLLFVISFAALWEGALLLPTLLHGFALTAVPASVARVAAVQCLGCGAGLFLIVLRMVERPEAAVLAGAIVAGAILAGCGSAGNPGPASGLPPSLLAQARPIGRGARFDPPASGPMIGACRPDLGPREGVHVELFAANRVVIVPSGIGTLSPRSYSAARISGARCYGDLVTLEPTGVVLVRPWLRLRLADLFRSWGQPLTAHRLASFAARAPVAVFVDGRRWLGPPGGVPLATHSEIVLEVGPHVPPHASYTFPPET